MKLSSEISWQGRNWKFTFTGRYSISDRVAEQGYPRISLAAQSFLFGMARRY
jgi:hypothetical protein